MFGNVSRKREKIKIHLIEQTKIHHHRYRQTKRREEYQEKPSRQGRQKKKRPKGYGEQQK
jgi:uncharacterized membrane protein YcaP (DUF421 family)